MEGLSTLGRGPKLNRLTSATEKNGTTTNWAQTYQCDQFGNLATTSSSANIPLSNLTPQATSAFNSKNQISANQYDPAGNMWMDAANNLYYYDGENHQTSCNVNVNGTASTSSYTYDADGHRISKTTSAGTTIFVYDAGGRMLAEYGGQTSSANAGTSYLTTDHLGSTRVVTNSTGGVVARHDYLPFGGELQSNIGGRATAQGYGSVDDTRQRFTSKERDTESTLDYFQARYFSSAQGRFTSPDEFTGGPIDVEDFTALASSNPTFYADIRDPQSLNKYQYCYNNPLRYVDPNGHDGGLVVLVKALEAGGAGIAAGGAAVLAAGAVAVHVTGQAIHAIGQGIEQGVHGVALGVQGVGHGIEAAGRGVAAYGGAVLGAISGSKQVVKYGDTVSKTDLRGSSLTSGSKKLRALGLKEQVGDRGRHEFRDKSGKLRAAWDPPGKYPAHWHKFAPNGETPVNNAGRVVGKKEVGAHIPSN